MQARVVPQSSAMLKCARPQSLVPLKRSTNARSSRSVRANALGRAALMHFYDLPCICHTMHLTVCGQMLLPESCLYYVTKVVAALKESTLGRHVSYDRLWLQANQSAAYVA